MKHLSPLLIALLAGCSPLHDRGEGYQQHYGTPSATTDSECVQRQKILHWTRDPKSKERVGFLERYRMRLRGMRDWREMHYILNAGGTSRLGFINEDGVFFRYDRQGHPVRVGEYPIIDTGLKVFLGYPLSDNLSLEDVDPYKD